MGALGVFGWVKGVQLVSETNECSPWRWKRSTCFSAAAKRLFKSKTSIAKRTSTASSRCAVFLSFWCSTQVSPNTGTHCYCLLFTAICYGNILFNLDAKRKEGWTWKSNWNCPIKGDFIDLLKLNSDWLFCPRCW